METRNTVRRILLVHLGSHGFWTLAYLISLLGVFILIPFVGCYNAFVLGFLGTIVLASPAKAVILGFVVFSVTGLLSGWLISLLRPRVLWLPALISVFLSYLVLLGATRLRYKQLSLADIEAIQPLSASSGRPDADTLKWALKAESDEELPPYVSGKDVIIPISDLLPSLSLLPKDFELKGGPYVYCNLRPAAWKRIKKGAPGQYPVLWATQPDANGNYLVLSINLKSDIFSDEIVSREQVTRALSNLELAIRNQTEDSGFTIQNKPGASPKE